jgi:hypothetical protein
MRRAKRIRLDRDLDHVSVLELPPKTSTSMGQACATESGQQQDNNAIKTQGAEPLASSGSGCSPCFHPADLAEWSRLDRAMRATSPHLLKAQAANSGKHKDNDAVEMRGASPARVQPANPCAQAREIAESSNIPLVEEPTGTVQLRSAESTRQSKERVEQGDSTPRQPCTNANSGDSFAVETAVSFWTLLDHRSHRSTGTTIAPSHWWLYGSVLQRVFCVLCYR